MKPSAEAIHRSFAGFAGVPEAAFPSDVISIFLSLSMRHSLMCVDLAPPRAAEISLPACDNSAGRCGRSRLRRAARSRLPVGFQEPLTDVDCSTRFTPSLYLRRCLHSDFDPGRGFDRAHARRYFPQYRHSRGQRSVAIHGPFAGGDVRPDRLQLRALADDDGQQHRAHRIAIAQRRAPS